MKEIDITGVKVTDITGTNSFYVDVELFCDIVSFLKSITWLK